MIFTIPYDKLCKKTYDTFKGKNTSNQFMNKLFFYITEFWQKCMKEANSVKLQNYLELIFGIG